MSQGYIRSRLREALTFLGFDSRLDNDFLQKEESMCPFMDLPPSSILAPSILGIIYQANNRASMCN